MYDQKLPNALKEVQEWFGGIISRPIGQQSEMNPIAPSGVPVKKEAPHYIKPSPTLQPDQRIQIYNQQYWWRLLNILHDIFPMATRLFGYVDFNRRLGIPYLAAFPPNHWSLNGLGGRFIDWARQNYKGKDKQLLLATAQVDLSFNDSFTAENQAPITLESLPNPNDLSILLSKQMALPKSLYLFEFDYDLFEFRVELLKQKPEYWAKHPFPVLKKARKYYFVMYRNVSNLLNWKEISRAEWLLLSQFENGFTVDAACDWLETQEDAVQMEAAENLHRWLQSWIILRWLV